MKPQVLSQDAVLKALEKVYRECNQRAPERAIGAVLIAKELGLVTPLRARLGLET